MASSEPTGDVYRLYLEHSLVLRRVEAVEEAMRSLVERFGDLTSRVVNLEPVRDSRALAVMGDGKTVDISALGTLYTSSPFLQALFTPDGHPKYNSTDPEKPSGFARGRFPENAEPHKTLYVCGDDYNEHSVSIFRYLLYPIALQHHERGDGLART